MLHISAFQKVLVKLARTTPAPPPNTFYIYEFCIQAGVLWSRIVGRVAHEV